MDVVTLGEILIDMFPSELGRALSEVPAFYPKPGGAPANVAVAVARLGLRSAFIGKVGEEAFGRHLVRVLQDSGVDTRGMRFDANARTTLAFIAMPDPNQAEFLFYRNPGADTQLRPDELDRDLLSRAKAFHFGSLSLIEEPARSATLEAVRIARAGGALISFDVNYRPRLWPDAEAARRGIRAAVPCADVLKVNASELVLLADTDAVDVAAAALLRLGPQLIVVTLGPRGSAFYTAAGSGRVPAFAVRTVDATGCGDAFIAGLLCQLVGAGEWRSRLAPDALRAAVRYANAVGGLTAQTLGVIPALPTAQQVEMFLAQN